MLPFLTVLTPAYNRAHTLTKCYNSLVQQSNLDFIWLIVDDGSIDATAELVRQWQSASLISIYYLYKSNGGKHTALNVGISYIDTELTIIVDSDDFLTKTAVETIRNVWSKYREVPGLCGMSFLRGYDMTTQIGKKFPEDTFISNHIECRYNQGVKGDKSEVFVTEILKKFPFPEIAGERFIGEGIVWNRMAHSYDMVYVNEIIYITEYLADGLTRAGRQLRIRCPVGGMINAREALSPAYKVKIRIKNILLYTCYGFFAGKTFKFMLGDSQHPLLVLAGMPFGYVLYWFWKIKYL